jgi:long-chain acyl-CoA synthetase
MGLTLAGLIRDRARQRGVEPAIVFGGDVTTYADLDRRSNQVARALRASGLGRGDRVAIIDRNGPEFFELLFGAAKIGAVLVAVNWRLAPSEMAFIITDATAAVLVVGPEVLDQLGDIGELPRVRLIVVLGRPPVHMAYTDWLAAQPDDDPGVATDDEDVVVQMYTSGTTGLPKGALTTNANFAAQLSLVSGLVGLTQRSTVLTVMPLYHIAGLANALLGFFCGAPVILHREVEPAAVLDAIEAHRVTFAILVPAVIQMVLAVPGIDGRDLSSIEAIGYGASPISEAVMLRACEVFGDLYQLYGLTETTGAVTALPPADHRADGAHPERLRSAGRPFPGQEVRVVEPGADGWTDLPVGRVGEVVIRGPLVMKGYWNRPEATAQAIDGDGWFHSGDAGYLDADGYLYIHDRLKDMIISGAENVYPAEVENVLMAHDAVADAAVIGVPDERWGETVKAVLVRAAGASADDADIIAFCQTRLGRFKCPTSIDWVEVLPRNPSGKILKRELREPYWVGRERAVN